MTVEVKVEAAIGLCTEYKKTAKGAKEEVSVIISPLKAVLSGSDGDRITISHGCNLWRSCSNKDCWYSLAGRGGKKAAGERG